MNFISGNPLNEAETEAVYPLACRRALPRIIRLYTLTRLLTVNFLTAA